MLWQIKGFHFLWCQSSAPWYMCGVCVYITGSSILLFSGQYSILAFVLQSTQKSTCLLSILTLFPLDTHLVANLMGHTVILWLIFFKEPSDSFPQSLCKLPSLVTMYKEILSQDFWGPGFASQHLYGSSKTPINSDPSSSNNPLWPLWAPSIHVIFTVKN